MEGIFMEKKEVQILIETSHGSGEFKGYYNILTSSIECAYDRELFSSYNLIIQNLIITYKDLTTDIEHNGSLEWDRKNGLELCDDDFKNNMLDIYNKEYSLYLKTIIENQTQEKETKKIIDRQTQELQKNYCYFKEIPCVMRQYMKDGSIINNDVKINTFNKDICFSQNISKERISLQELFIEIDAVCLKLNITPGYSKINDETQELLLDFFQDNTHRIENRYNLNQKFTEISEGFKL